LIDRQPQSATVVCSMAQDMKLDRLLDEPGAAVAPTADAAQEEQVTTLPAFQP
jgi:hypothetical protein